MLIMAQFFPVFLLIYLPNRSLLPVNDAPPIATGAGILSNSFFFLDKFVAQLEEFIAI